MDCHVAALLAVTGVARLQAVAKCRHCEAVGRGNPCIHRLPGANHARHKMRLCGASGGAWADALWLTALDDFYEYESFHWYILKYQTTAAGACPSPP